MDNEDKETKLHVRTGPDNSLLIIGYGSMSEEIAALKEKLRAAEWNLRYLQNLATKNALRQQRLSKTLDRITHILLRRHGEIVLAEPSSVEYTRELEINKKLLDIINAFFEAQFSFCDAETGKDL